MAPSHTCAPVPPWQDAKLGTFCEAKNSQIGDGAKIPHLSYVGDATIGEGANIGAGSIFANYNGLVKSRSVIGAHARMGAAVLRCTCYRR